MIGCEVGKGSGTLFISRWYNFTKYVEIYGDSGEYKLALVYQQAYVSTMWIVLWTHPTTPT